MDMIDPEKISHIREETSFQILGKIASSKLLHDTLCRKVNIDLAEDLLLHRLKQNKRLSEEVRADVISSAYDLLQYFKADGVHSHYPNNKQVITSEVYSHMPGIAVVDNYGEPITFGLSNEAEEEINGILTNLVRNEYRFTTVLLDKITHKLWPQFLIRHESGITRNKASLTIRDIYYLAKLTRDYIKQGVRRYEQKTEI
jgi:hypothetical protein